MNSNRFFIILYMVIVWSFMSCSDNNGFFSNMPNRFRIDSLEAQTLLFENLKFEVKDNGNTLVVMSDDCNLIPFCGVLKYKQDTVFFERLKGDSVMFFLALNVPVESTHIVKYSDVRWDKVIFKSYNKGTFLNDSLYVFELIPLKRKSVPDATFLKYILVSKNGIKGLTFFNRSAQYTVAISEYPKIVFIIDN